MENHINPEIQPEMKVVLVDEKSADYPFDPELAINSVDTNMTFTFYNRADGERPYSDQEVQTRIGRRLASALRVKKGELILDVGPGSNPYVSDGLCESTLKPAILVDHLLSDEAKQSQHLGLQIPFSEIDTEPQTRGQKFGVILFNGSLFAEGTNLTLLATAQEESNSEKKGPINTEETLKSIVKTSLDRLSKDGVLIITSSRFSRHGSGFAPPSWPDEKSQFLKIIDAAKKLGATEITIFMLSGERVTQLLSRSSPILDQLSDQSTGFGRIDGLAIRL